MNQNFNKNTNLTKKKFKKKRFCKNTYTHIKHIFPIKDNNTAKDKNLNTFSEQNITTLQKEEEGKKKQGTLMVFSQGAFNPA